jgi:hypothetical protein
VVISPQLAVNGRPFGRAISSRSIAQAHQAWLEADVAKTQAENLLAWGGRIRSDQREPGRDPSDSPSNPACATDGRDSRPTLQSSLPLSPVRLETKWIRISRSTREVPRPLSRLTVCGFDSRIRSLGPTGGGAFSTGFEALLGGL